MSFIHTTLHRPVNYIFISSIEKQGRLKAAVEEARGEIEKYRKEREKEFSEQQDKVMFDLWIDSKNMWISRGYCISV